MFPHYDKYERRNYLKLWLFGLLLMTVVYILYCSFCPDEFMTISIPKYGYRNVVRSITPAFPPPLTNFMDTPKQFY